MNEIEEIIYDVVKAILPNFNQNNICREHQAFGQPSFSNTEDRIFFDVIESESNIAKEIYFEDNYNSVKDSIERTHGKTITINVKFVVYGPHSYNNSLLIRDGFFLESTRKTLREHDIFIVPYHQLALFYQEQLNGVWYQRYDFEITFNRWWTAPVEEINYINNANIIVEGE